MKPWQRLDRTETPDGKELLLCRRDQDFVIRVNGFELMTSRAHGSEDALAHLAAQAVGSVAAPRWLIGGLGMGFTLRAALNALPLNAVVDVAELVPAVVDWNRNALGQLANHPLRDARVSVHECDVSTLIRQQRSTYDAIVLDVDNGPIALSHDDNAQLYEATGLHAAKAALKPRGVLAVWSADDAPEFTRRLESAGFAPHVHSVGARGRSGGPQHTLWIAAVRA